MLSLVGNSGGYSRIAVCRLLTAVEALAAGRGLWGLRASVAAAHRFSSSMYRALEHRLSNWHMRVVARWHGGLPRPRIALCLLHK